jgi:stage III sporulation protein SpoIIIAA
MQTHELGITQLRVTDNMEELLEILPPQIKIRIEEQEDCEDLLEIVMDLGREPEARFPFRVLRFPEHLVKQEDLDYVSERVGAFGKDNRAGIEKTLHRISAIRNRQGTIIGLTCRIGRAVYGTIDIIRDVVESGKSILMLGKPGVGKTTKLREVARVLADEFKKRVIIVDTSNEIAGDGDIPHPAIGHARRMQVPTPTQQESVMIEAVENHMPEVVVIDEIGTQAEAEAARTIAERGVMLVATAHGISLENLVTNPTLSDLIGGIQAVTLSDDEARRRGTQKTVLERKAAPTFDILIEITEMDKLAIHNDVAGTVDRMLRGVVPRPEIRIRSIEGQVKVVQPAAVYEEHDDHRDKYEPTKQMESAKPLPSVVRLFPYGVSRNRLEKAIRELRVPAQLSRTIEGANLIITLKTHERKHVPVIAEAGRKGIPIYVIKSNTYAQISGIMREVFNLGPSDDEEEAIQEADDAIQLFNETGESQELSPRSAFLRRLQHQYIERFDLQSQSIGTEPYRRVRIFKL